MDGGFRPKYQGCNGDDQNPKEPKCSIPGAPQSRALHLLTSLGQDPIPGRRSQSDKKKWVLTHSCLFSQHSVSLPIESPLVFYLKATLKSRVSSERGATATQKGSLSNQRTPLGDFRHFDGVLTTPGLRALRSTCLCSLPPHCPSMLRWSTVALTLPLTCLPAKVDHLMIVWNTYN